LLELFFGDFAKPKANFASQCNSQPSQTLAVITAPKSIDSH